MKFKKAGMIFAVAVMGWICFIFYMSSQTAVNSGHMSRAVTKYLVRAAETVGIVGEGASYSEHIIQNADIIVRDLAHMVMYFLLTCIFSAMLWMLGIKGHKWIPAAFIIGTGISVVDEINQMHYYGRNSAGLASEGIQDVLKDVFGICVAIGIFNLLRRKNKSRSDSSFL